MEEQVEEVEVAPVAVEVLSLQLELRTKQTEAAAGDTEVDTKWEPLLYQDALEQVIRKNPICGLHLQTDPASL
jgi:hypothetical protein